MTLPIDLALLETGAAASVGGFLGLASAAARAGRTPAEPATRAGRTFLLVWIPPALARLATMLPMADPRTSPELALPLAAPASATLAVLLVLAPLAYRAIRNEPAERRKVLGAAGIAAAIAVAAIGFVASPFDSSRLADAVADHASRCEALARTASPLPPDATRPLRSMAERERKESAIDAAGIHDSRGLAPALARLEERRRAFASSVSPVAASLESRALAAQSEAQTLASTPSDESPFPPTPAPGRATIRTPGRAPAGPAGCAAVEPGMAAREVERLLGAPDQRVSAEDVRGPRAERWAYSRLLCRIHLVDGIVEFVD